MVNTEFEIILKDFEPFFQFSLKPDQNESCLIKMGMGISIQIELTSQSQLLVGCRLGALPTSSYRTTIFKEALKSNETSSLLSLGVFGFSQKSQQLIFFMLLNPNHLNADKTSTLMQSFITKAKQWADAISKGEIPSSDQINRPLPSPMGAFESTL